MTRRSTHGLLLPSLLAACTAGGDGGRRNAGTAADAPAAAPVDTPLVASRATAPARPNCGVVTGRELVPGGVGRLRVGRTAAEVRRDCLVVRDTTQLDDEALPERVLTVRTPRGEVEAVLDDSARVWRVAVALPTLRTADSLGVGSTLGALLAAPGARGVQGERGVYVIPGGKCGLSFHLAYAVPAESHRDTWSVADLARLPDTTRVDEVLAVVCAR